MGAEKNIVVFQCMQCGELHEVDMVYDPEDDIYIKMRCPKCKEVVSHLFCGDRNSAYYYYSLNADNRYYKYNTK